MRISIEISYYPLREEFIPAILDFLDRLGSYDDIEVQTNGMSTQVFGQYDDVMSIITKEIKESMSLPYSVFVLKLVNNDLQILPSTHE
jgi:uncharacterized protein YqgV (UPF0045/DUF77 family)